ATSIIRNDLKSDVPIIAMTANGMAGEKEKCLQAGMNDYISKPIHAELLFEKIHALISLNAKKQVGDIEKNKIINIDFLIRTMHEKKDIIKETIDIVLEQMPEDIADINDAILKTNYEKIRRSAHKMKSTVSIMSMTSIQRILEEMETLGAAAREIEKIKTLNNSLNLLTEKATQELKNEQLNYT
ncbi:MAG TPA: Hpt domain-containing protein, partial [Bacteroidia bacterium]|nr:Hpt domain-containing protein [Bacteroidia bacterium]